MSGKPKDKTGRVAATNRKARHEYSVLDRLEAGIALLGTEVKSLRAGNADLAGGYAAIEDGDVILHDVHIKPYEFGNQFNHEPRRPRRLLLHKREIRKLAGQVTLKGRTLIPLRLYFNDRGRVKVELGLCQGKQRYDKRETLRRKTADREAARAMAARR